MSLPQFAMPGGARVQHVTAGLVAAIAAVSLLVEWVPEVYLRLAAPLGPLVSISYAAQVWRPFTAALLAPGILSLLLVGIFTYWCGADLEAELGPRRYLAVVVNTALGAAVAAALLPGWGLIGTASAMAWGLIGASTLRAYARGFNINTQLVIVAVLLIVNLQAGMASLLLCVGGLAGGTAAAAVMSYLPQRQRRTRPDDWSRRTTTQSAQVDTALVALGGALLVAWILLQLV